MKERQRDDSKNQVEEHECRRMMVVPYVYVTYQNNLNDWQLNTPFALHLNLKQI